LSAVTAAVGATMWAGNSISLNAATPASMISRPWYSGNIAAETLYGPPAISASLQATPSQPKPTTSNWEVSPPCDSKAWSRRAPSRR
jgi:hypothetical protein